MVIKKRLKKPDGTGSRPTKPTEYLSSRESGGKDRRLKVNRKRYKKHKDPPRYGKVRKLKKGKSKK